MNDVVRPRISIVLPVYFGRQADAQQISQLGRAIDSVFAQTFPDEWELLLIDDGNEVPLQTLMAGRSAYADRRVEIHRVPINSGLVNALNTGLALARFELIARLDADDYWLDGKLARQLNRFAQDSSLTLSATGMTLNFEDGAAAQEIIRPDGWQNILRFTRDVGCPFPHGSVIGRKDVFRALGGYSHAVDARHAEDFELWTRWIRFFKPAMEEKSFYHYTVAAGSVSISQGDAQRRASSWIHQRYLALGRIDDIPAQIEELAELLGITVLETGFLLHALWKHRPSSFALPVASVPLIRRILSDRRLFSTDTPARSSWSDLLSASVTTFQRASRADAHALQSIEIF